MHHKQRIIEAFESNQIKKILLIDDAYDPPEFDEALVAALADFLASDEGRNVCDECGIKREVISSATGAAEEGATDNDDVKFVCTTLYDKYVETRDGRFDLDARFDAQKGSALAALRPLETLLRLCGETVEVKTVGLDNAMPVFSDFQPEVLFLDYFLSPDVSAARTSDDQQMAKAREASLSLLRELIRLEEPNTIPAIVLMSSQENPEVKQYRHDAGDHQLLSLRFNFLHKKLVHCEDEEIVVDYDAASTLLDTSQGFRFGKQIQQALRQVNAGAEDALNEFKEAVSDLDIKDFVYLLRFRLRKDGQPLGEYLMWLFGEFLKSLIEEKVDWSHSSFSSLDENEEPEKLIEGAHEGPSNQIAQLFHQVRIDEHGKSSQRVYQLGDLYAHRVKDEIRVVITPDCDLIKRDKKKPKAKRLLTMVGAKNTLDQEDSLADNFFIQNNMPYSINWNPKHLETFPIKGKKSLKKNKNFEFIGTLRPIYAQEIQRQVLTDLSRIGLPVAPAFGINVPLIVQIRLNENETEELQFRSKAVGTIIPPRAPEKAPRVLLRRRTFYELMDQLQRFDLRRLKQKYKDKLNSACGREGFNRLHDEYLKKGAVVGKTMISVSLVGGTEQEMADDSFLQIALEMNEKVTDLIPTVGND